MTVSILCALLTVLEQLIRTDMLLASKRWVSLAWSFILSSFLRLCGGACVLTPVVCEQGPFQARPCRCVLGFGVRW